MHSQSYLNTIKDLHHLSQNEVVLWDILMYSENWNVDWPETLKDKVSNWGKQYGTQSFDIRADLIAEWIKDNREF